MHSTLTDVCPKHVGLLDFYKEKKSMCSMFHCLQLTTNFVCLLFGVGQAAHFLLHSILHSSLVFKLSIPSHLHFEFEQEKRCFV